MSKISAPRTSWRWNTLLSENDALVLNLGTGTGCSVRDLIDAVARVSGHDVPVTEEARLPGDSPALIADPARIQQVLGWCPTYTDIDAIVATAWKWHAERNAGAQS